MLTQVIMLTNPIRGKQILLNLLRNPGTQIEAYFEKQPQAREEKICNYSGIGITPDFSLVTRQKTPPLLQSALADWRRGDRVGVMFLFHQTKVWCCPNRQEDL